MTNNLSHGSRVRIKPDANFSLLAGDVHSTGHTGKLATVTTGPDRQGDYRLDLDDETGHAYASAAGLEVLPSSEAPELAPGDRVTIAAYPKTADGGYTHWERSPESREGVVVDDGTAPPVGNVAVRARSTDRGSNDVTQYVGRQYLTPAAASEAAPVEAPKPTATLAAGTLAHVADGARFNEGDSTVVSRLNDADVRIGRGPDGDGDYHVEALRSNAKGYVGAEYLEPIPEPEPSTLTVGTLVRVRQGARFGLGAAPVWSSLNGAVARIVHGPDDEGDYRVTASGAAGYVAARYLEVIPEPEPASVPTEPADEPVAVPVVVDEGSDEAPESAGDCTCEPVPSARGYEFALELIDTVDAGPVMPHKVRRIAGMLAEESARMFGRQC